jgi:hypothetical protein
VYNPAELIVPTLEFPPTMLFTCQMTPLLLAFFTVAVNCCVRPMGTVTLVGEIETDTPALLPLLHPIIKPVHRIAKAAASCFIRSPRFPLGYGAVTVSVAAGLVTVPTEAVITVMPGAMPVATPLLPTMATPAALLRHVKVTGVTVFPLLSTAVAVNCWVWPTLIVALLGASVTDAIGVLEFTTVRLAAALVTPDDEAVI